MYYETENKLAKIIAQEIGGMKVILDKECPPNNIYILNNEKQCAKVILYKELIETCTRLFAEKING